MCFLFLWVRAVPAGAGPTKCAYLFDCELGYCEHGDRACCGRRTPDRLDLEITMRGRQPCIPVAAIGTDDPVRLVESVFLTFLVAETLKRTQEMFSDVGPSGAVRGVESRQNGTIEIGNELAHRAVSFIFSR